MKILGTLFRLLCALVVLLAVAIYLDGSLQVSLLDYLAAFTPAHIQALAVVDSWQAIAAGALLLLTLCCGIKLGWNLVYALATFAFFAEAAVLTLGAELAMPTAIRGLGWEPLVGSLALNYPVPTLMVPVLCIIGCLCATAPVRIAWTSLVSCVLTYACAELLYQGLQYWQGMPEPFMPQVLETVQLFPWSLAALPAVFFLQYTLFMAMFEAFIPRRKKAKVEATKDEKKQDKPAAATAVTTAPAKPTATPAKAATISVTATPVTPKKPVVVKKNPISPAAPKAKAEEAKPEAPAKEEEAPKADSPGEAPAKEEEAPKADALAEAPAKEEAPKADAPAEAPAKEEAPKAEAPAEAPAKEEAPKADAPAAPAAGTPAEEKKEETPDAIPSVPLPPTPNAAS